MKITNAIKKLEKAGFTVVQNGMFYRGTKPGHSRFVTFSSNGASGNVATIGVRRHGDQDDAQSDYFATSYCDSMAQAIRWAEQSGVLPKHGDTVVDRQGALHVVQTTTDTQVITTRNVEFHHTKVWPMNS